MKQNLKQAKLDNVVFYTGQSIFRAGHLHVEIMENKCTLNNS